MMKEKHVAVAANRVLVDGDIIRFVNTTFAFCFKEARLNTQGGSDVEHNKSVGHFSTFVRGLTSVDRVLFSHIGEIDESQAEIVNTLLHHHPINNHDVAAIES